MNQADNILHRIDPADDVGDMGDGRKFRAPRDDLFNGLFRIASVHLTVQENQLCAGDAGCHLPGKQVAVMGINKSIEREGQDRYDIQLPADQREFLQEIYKVNPNIIVVLVAGSSLAVNWMDEHIPAIVNAWYPGEQGGTAVATCCSAIIILPDVCR